MTILLGTASQDLIARLCEKDKNFALKQAATMERATLLDWLEKTHQINSDEDTFFLIASLQASLLKDLNDSLNSGTKKKKKTKTADWSGKAKYGLLALAGTIYFGCEGFDGITAIMGAFSSVPTIAIFAVGTLFSVLSVLVFYSFDLVEISKNLGVKSSDTPKLLDVLLDEFKQIKAMRTRLSKSTNKTQEELENDLALARLLLKKHEDLNEARTKIQVALENPYLKMGKMATAGVAGVIFFSGGFFAGQTVALAIAGVFVTSIAATAWPILLASIGVGLAAFSVYWFVERPGIENLISRWRGLDKGKVDKLCSSEVVERETEKLQNLINELEEKINLHKANTHKQNHVHELEVEVTRLNHQLAEMKKTLHETKPPQVTRANNDEQIEKEVVVQKLEAGQNERSQSAHTQCSLFSKSAAVLREALQDRSVPSSLLGEPRRTKSTGDLRVDEHKYSIQA